MYASYTVDSTNQQTNAVFADKALDWIVQCFTSPPTQYRLYGRRFLQVKRPNQQYQSTEGSYKGTMLYMHGFVTTEWL